MIELTVDVDNQTGLVGMITGVTRQLPFAYSLAINKTLDSAQSAVRQTLPEHFTLRHQSFIENTIYIGPSDRARKDSLVGTVRVNPARDFLAKFETGGEKTGQHALAVPIIRQGHPNIIIRRDDPRNIKRVMQLIADQGGKNVGPFKRRGQKRAAQQSFFVLHSRSGKTLVMQRDASRTFVLYDLEREVPIPADLHFDETAMNAAVAAWDANFADALDYAMATAR